MSGESLAPIDLGPALQRIEFALEHHALGRPGAFARFTRPGPAGDRAVGLDPYGCADAANLLWTLDRFPDHADLRGHFVDTLQGMQDPVSGLWHESTHDPVHTTAHCIAALELFDARPLHPLAALAPYRDAAQMERFLDTLPWRENAWHASHRGAGLYAALMLAGEVDAAWEERYFDWLAREVDPATGLLRRGAVPAGEAGEPHWFGHLAGTFHYLFNFEHRGRALPFAAARVETCLRIHQRERFPLARFLGFAEVDWVYVLHRALRDAPDHTAEAQRSIDALARRYVALLSSLDPATDAGLDDLHAVFGAASALAALQQAIPDRIAPGHALRLVLDRRPFL